MAPAGTIILLLKLIINILDKGEGPGGGVATGSRRDRRPADLWGGSF